METAKILITSQATIKINPGGWHATVVYPFPHWDVVKHASIWVDYEWKAFGLAVMKPLAQPIVQATTAHMIATWAYMAARPRSHTHAQTTAMVGGWWRLPVAKGWRLAVCCRWRLAVVVGWRCVAVGGWRAVPNKKKIKTT